MKKDRFCKLCSSTSVFLDFDTNKWRTRKGSGNQAGQSPTLHTEGRGDCRTYVDMYSYLLSSNSSTCKHLVPITVHNFATWPATEPWEQESKEPPPPGRKTPRKTTEIKTSKSTIFFLVSIEPPEISRTNDPRSSCAIVSSRRRDRNLKTAPAVLRSRRGNEGRQSSSNISSQGRQESLHDNASDTVDDI